jgi:hypothetical protein
MYGFIAMFAARMKTVAEGTGVFYLPRPHVFIRKYNGFRR